MAARSNDLNLDDTDLGGRYLKHESFQLPDGKYVERHMTIRDVQIEEAPNGDSLKVVYFAAPDGSPSAKGLVLNKTNYGRIRDAYGPVVSGMLSKPVILYTEATQRPDGTPTRGVRVRVPDPELGLDPNLGKDDE